MSGEHKTQNINLQYKTKNLTTYYAMYKSIYPSMLRRFKSDLDEICRIVIPVNTHRSTESYVTSYFQDGDHDVIAAAVGGGGLALARWPVPDPQYILVS